ncbi:dihydrolipoyl dehydrogenase [bacterium]|nr:dihydrolipoyl dehydrogenase [bacterium]MBU1024726.1 dihydrolipoyl dehydrogenase [bacterium]
MKRNLPNNMIHYDGIFIGGGPSGYEAALYARRFARKVAIVEKYRLGGVCLHTGCIPTKTLLASAKSYMRAKNLERYGIDASEIDEFEWSAVQLRKRKVIDDNTTGLEKLMESKGIAMLYGTGSFLDKNTIRVSSDDGKESDISGDRIFVATGSKPLPVPGIKCHGDLVIPGEHCLSWETLPDSILIVGGGVMGCEMACAFAPYGIEVHLIELMEDILPTEDIDVSKTLRRELKKLGVKLYLGKKLENLEFPGSKVSFEVEGKGKFSVDKVLVCAGRGAILDDLNLENAGVKLESHGSIEVDEYQRTNIDNIYASGDVAGPPYLAHAASYTGKISVLHAFDNPVKKDLKNIPAGIFTFPEVGRVGKTEQQCREEDIDYKIGIGQMRRVGRSHAEGETAGFAKIIVDSDDKIIGGHLVGKDAGEIIHIVALAMVTEMTSHDLEDKLIFSHPTISEVLWEALKELHS